MSCGCNALNGGITKGCLGNIGGIRKMYITDFCNITGLTLNSDNSIGGITMAANTYFYEFEFTKGSSTFQEEFTGDPATGTQLNTQTITLTLARREKAKRDILMLLAGYKELGVIITEANGDSYLMGQENGVIMLTNLSVAGTASTDANNYVITMVGEETALAETVDNSIIAGLLAP